MNTIQSEDSWESFEDKEVIKPPASTKGDVVPYDPLQRYLYEVNRYLLLTPEEEKVLLAQ
jgi:hypothetical protein